MRIFGREAVTDHQNVGNEAVRNFCVVDFFRTWALCYRVAHVGIPGDRSVNFLLREQRGRFDSVLGVDGFVKNFISLICAQPRSL